MALIEYQESVFKSTAVLSKLNPKHFCLFVIEQTQKNLNFVLQNLFMDEEAV